MRPEAGQPSAGSPMHRSRPSRRRHRRSLGRRIVSFLKRALNPFMWFAGYSGHRRRRRSRSRPSGVSSRFRAVTTRLESASEASVDFAMDKVARRGKKRRGVPESTTLLLVVPLIAVCIPAYAFFMLYNVEFPIDAPFVLNDSRAMRSAAAARRLAFDGKLSSGVIEPENLRRIPRLTDHPAVSQPPLYPLLLGAAIGIHSALSASAYHDGVAIAASTLFWYLSLLLVFNAAARIENARVGLLALILCVLSPYYLRSATSGSEVPLTGFLLIGFFLAFVGTRATAPEVQGRTSTGPQASDVFKAGLWGGMLILARYEMLLVIVPCLLFLAVAPRAKGERLALAGGLALPIVPWLLWCWLATGNPFFVPFTALLRVGADAPSGSSPGVWPWIAAVANRVVSGLHYSLLRVSLQAGVLASVLFVCSLLVAPVRDIAHWARFATLASGILLLAAWGTVSELHSGALCALGPILALGAGLGIKNLASRFVRVGAAVIPRVIFGVRLRRQTLLNWSGPVLGVLGAWLFLYLAMADPIAARGIPEEFAAFQAGGPQQEDCVIISDVPEWVSWFTRQPSVRTPSNRQEAELIAGIAASEHLCVRVFMPGGSAGYAALRLSGGVPWRPDRWSAPESVLQRPLATETSTGQPEDEDAVLDLARTAKRMPAAVAVGLAKWRNMAKALSNGDPNALVYAASLTCGGGELWLDVLAWYGRGLEDIGHYYEALNSARRLHTMAPASRQAWLRLGEVCLHFGWLEAAEVAARRLEELPETEAGLRVLFRIYTARREDSKCTGCLDRMVRMWLKRGWSYRQAHMLALRCCAESGNRLVGDSVCEKLPLLFPADEEMKKYLPVYRAELLLGCGDPLEAAKTIDRHLRVHTDWPMLRLRLLESYDRASLWMEALGEFQKLPEEIKKQPNVIALHADLLGRSGDRTAALDLCTEAIAQYPGSAALHHAMAYWSARGPGSLAVAERSARIALRSSPYELVYVDTLAWILHLSGRDQEGFDLLEPYSPIVWRHPEIEYHFGTVLLATGREHRGLRHIRRAVKNAPPGARWADAATDILNRSGEQSR